MTPMSDASLALPSPTSNALISVRLVREGRVDSFVDGGQHRVKRM